MTGKVGGTATGDFDEVNVTGVATLAGTFTATLVTGFTPGPGLLFPVLSYADESGSFTTFNSPLKGGVPVFTTQIHPTSFDLSTDPAVSLSPASLPDDTVNLGYDQIISASGGTGTIDLAVSNLTNPIPGLTVPASGTGSLTVSGTPTATGTETFTVTATDSLGGTNVTTYSITVNPAVSLSPASLPDDTVNAGYDQTISASGGTGTIDLVVSDVTNAIPGLTVPASGTGSLTVTGTPTATGTETFTVTATDSLGATNVITYSITVIPVIYSWTGNADGCSWGNPGNWIPNSVPQSSDDVDFSNLSAHTVITLAPAEAQPITIFTATESGCTVSITTTENDGVAPGQSVVIADMGVAGYDGTFPVLSVPSPTTFTYMDLTTGLANSGGGTANVVNDAAGATINNLTVSSPVTFSGGTLTVDGRMTDSSPLTLGAGATLSVSQGFMLADVTVGAGSTLSGQGTVQGNLVNNGWLDMGPTPGVITVDGDVTQGSTGWLTLKVGGSGANDELDVLGTATLDGTLDAVLSPDFTPTPGQTFQILDLAQTSGSFSAFVSSMTNGGSDFGMVSTPTGFSVVANTPPPAVSVSYSYGSPPTATITASNGTIVLRTDPLDSINVQVLMDGPGATVSQVIAADNVKMEAPWSPWDFAIVADSETVDILNVPADATVTVTGAAGTNIVNVGSEGNQMSTINGDLTVSGSLLGLGTTTLNVLDQSDPQPGTWTIGNGNVSVTNPATEPSVAHSINFLVVENVVVFAGGGPNSFTVNDTDYILSALTLNTGAADGNVVTVEATLPNSTLNINNVASTDTYVVNTGLYSNTTINDSPDDDTITLGNDSNFDINSVEGIQGAVNIQGNTNIYSGGPDSASLFIDDSADTATHTGNNAATVTNSIVDGLLPGVVNYAPFTLGSLTITGGTGGTTWDVQSTAADDVLPGNPGGGKTSFPSAGQTEGTGIPAPIVVTTTTTINCDGADTVNVGVNGSVQGIAGPLDIFGTMASPIVSVNLDDHLTAYGTPAAVAITSTSVAGLAPAEITYSMLNTSDLVLIGGGLIPGGVSNLTVQAGTGGTQFTVGDMTGGPTDVDLSAGGTGNSIVGPDAYTAWTFQQVNGQVPDSFTQASGSVASTVYFSGIGAITGGSGGNEFVFIQTGFAGSIDGGAGDNTLDFTAYGAAVTVTVTAAGTLHGVQGTATPITNNGTFNNIDNIIGAPGSTLDGSNFLGDFDTNLTVAGFHSMHMHVHGNFSGIFKETDSTPIDDFAIDGNLLPSGLIVAASVDTLEVDGAYDGGSFFSGAVGTFTAPEGGPGELIAKTIAKDNAPSVATYTTPPAVNIAPGDTLGLIQAIDQADKDTVLPNVINLDVSSTGVVAAAPYAPYLLTTPDNSWYGPNGLPAIASNITINGNGAVIERAAGATPFRIFYVSGGGDLDDNALAAGTLTLSNLTIEGGLAQGGNGGAGVLGGGGGAGLGGAIFNQGTLNLSGVTLTLNIAQGGNGVTSDFGEVQNGDFSGGGGGGGLGGNGGDGSSLGVNTGGGGGGGGFATAGDPGSTASGGSGGNGTNSQQEGGSGGPGSGGDGEFGGGGGGGGPEAYLNSGGSGGVGGGGGGAGGGIDGGPGGAGGFGGGGGGAGTGSGGDGGFGGGGGASPDGGGDGGFGGGSSAGALNGGGGGGGMGGAIFNMGGSLTMGSGTLTITNSTLAANIALGGTSPNGTGGSGYGGAVFNLNGTAILVNDTLAGNYVVAGSSNSDADADDLYNLALIESDIPDDSSPNATVLLTNDILGGTSGSHDLVTDSKAGPNSAVATFSGPSLVQQGTSGTIGLEGNSTLISPADPMLGPLQDNGGPTPAMEVLAGSPVLTTAGLGPTNAGGAPLDDGVPLADQRGVPRGAITDLGAYQATATQLVVSGFPDNVYAGAPHSFTVTATDPFGKTDYGYAGTVAVSSTDPQAIFSPQTSTLTDGVGTFSGTMVTVGVQALSATDNSSPSLHGSELPIFVQPAAGSQTGAGDQLVPGPNSPRKQHISLATLDADPLSVQVTDAYGNALDGIPVLFSMGADGVATASFTDVIDGTEVDSTADTVTVDTNSLGYASVGVQPNGVADDGGDYPVTAKIGNQSLEFDLTNDFPTPPPAPSAPPTQVVYSNPPPPTVAVGQSFGITADFADANGNPTTASPVAEFSSIASITGNCTDATVTTASANGLQPGQLVNISGVSPAGYDGYSTILSVPTPTSFTYANTTMASGTGGVVAVSMSGTSCSAVFVQPSTASTITGASESGTTVTIATAAPHGLQVGQTVAVVGVGVGYDGINTITSTPTPTTFTYTDTTSGLADSGGGTVTAFTPVTGAPTVTETMTGPGFPNGTSISVPVTNGVATFADLRLFQIGKYTLTLSSETGRRIPKTCLCRCTIASFGTLELWLRRFNGDVRVQCVKHVWRLPCPIQSAVARHALTHPRKRFLPAIAEHVGTNHQ